MIAKAVSVLLTLLASALPVASSTVGHGPVLHENRGPAERATGGVWYEAGVTSHISFVTREAKGNRPAGGRLHYANANGERYDVRISQVNVVGDMAYFAGEVISSSVESWEGKWLSAAVHDGGTPGRNGDHVWVVLTDMVTAISNVNSQVAPGGKHAVFKGNLVVHSFNGPPGPPSWVVPEPADEEDPQGPPSVVPPGPPWGARPDRPGEPGNPPGPPFLPPGRA